MLQNRAKKRSLVGRFRIAVVFLTIFSLLVPSLFISEPAAAAPVNSYRWNNNNTISMSAASGEKGSGTLQQFRQDPEVYTGGFRSTNKSWLGLSEEDCFTTLWFRMDGPNSATRIRPIISDTGNLPQCRDMPAFGAKINIQGERPAVPETNEGKTLRVRVLGNAGNKPVSVIIKQNGKVVKTISTTRDADGDYVGADTLEAGKYTAECNKGLPFQCGVQTFEKIRTVEKSITLGQTEDDQLLKFRLFVDCSLIKDPPPYQLGIYDAKNKRIANLTTSPGISVDEGDLPGVFYTGCVKLYTAGPLKLAPGEYTGCIVQREWCDRFTKVFAEGETVDLLFGFEAIPDDDPACVGGMLGWLLCPMAEMMRKFTQTAAKIVEGLLYVEPLTLNTSSSNPIYTIWSMIRDIANIVFIILFLMIIFSHSTSLGISNYGIKRLLPRLLIMAVLVNISYFLCAFAIDIFNLIGAGVKGLVEVGIRAAPEPNLGKEKWDGSYGGFYAAIFGSIIVLLIAGPIWTMLAAIFSMIAFAVLAGFIMLVARQVIIVLLVLLSPLAFAAALLPNTEQYYQKWRKTFTSMLISYPILMFLYYGSVLVAMVVGATMGPK